MCFLKSNNKPTWENTQQIDKHGLISTTDTSSYGDTEWHNPSNTTRIEFSAKLNFVTSGDRLFSVDLRPCQLSYWSVVIGEGDDWGPSLQVKYRTRVNKADINRKFVGADTDISSLGILNDNLYHDFSVVVDRLSGQSLLFDVSIDDVPRLSFTFTYGMNDETGTPVSDSHVMAINEFGYSRTITFSVDTLSSVYLSSFYVGGQPMKTNRYDFLGDSNYDCSREPTKTGAKPVDAEAVSPCDPTQAPTVSPTGQNTAAPITGPPSTSPTRSSTTKLPTTAPVASTPSTSPTRSPTTKRPTTSPTTFPTTFLTISTANTESSTYPIAMTEDPTPAPTVSPTRHSSSGASDQVIATQTTAKDVDDGSGAKNKNDLFLPVVLTLGAVIVFLCISLLLTCSYVKRKQSSMEVTDTPRPSVMPGQKREIRGKKSSAERVDEASQSESDSSGAGDTGIEGGQHVHHWQGNVHLEMREFIVEGEEGMEMQIATVMDENEEEEAHTQHDDEEAPDEAETAEPAPSDESEESDPFYDEHWAVNKVTDYIGVSQPEDMDIIDNDVPTNGVQGNDQRKYGGNEKFAMADPIKY